MTDVAPVSQLAPGVHRIDLGFVSAYLLKRDDDLTLIDAGFPVDGPAIADAIGSLGSQLSDLKRIVLTHGHIDHFGAAAALRSMSGARILLSRADAAQIARGKAGHAPMEIQPGFDELVVGQLSDPDFVRKTEGRDTATPMDIDPFVIDGFLEAGKPVEGVVGSELIPTPGHCRGQMSIILDWEGGIMFTGDAAVNFGGPPSPAPLAEDLDVARESFELLKRFDFEIAAFGHGEPVVTGASRAFRQE